MVFKSDLERNALVASDSMLLGQSWDFCRNSQRELLKERALPQLKVEAKRVWKASELEECGVFVFLVLCQIPTWMIG